MVTIALARTARDEARIERALDAAGIAYTFTLDAAEPVEEGTVCYLGRRYEVGEEDAARARAALAQSGAGVG
jgi:hypothetical protein